MSSFNPLAGKIGAAAAKTPNLTPGKSRGTFVGGDFLPATPGKNKFPTIQLKFKLLDGPDAGKTATADIPPPKPNPDGSMPSNCKLAEWLTKLAALNADGSYDIDAQIGKRGVVSIAEKVKKDGSPSGWFAVVDFTPDA